MFSFVYFLGFPIQKYTWVKKGVFFKQNFLEFFALLDIFKNVQFLFFEGKVLKVEIEKCVLQSNAVISIFALKNLAA